MITLVSTRSRRFNDCRQYSESLSFSKGIFWFALRLFNWGLSTDSIDFDCIRSVWINGESAGLEPSAPWQHLTTFTIPSQRLVPWHVCHGYSTRIITMNINADVGQGSFEKLTSMWQLEAWIDTGRRDNDYLSSDNVNTLVVYTSLLNYVSLISCSSFSVILLSLPLSDLFDARARIFVTGQEFRETSHDFSLALCYPFLVFVFRVMQFCERDTR
jgi:hypothetical protein